jgi:hypothetical protein
MDGMKPTEDRTMSSFGSRCNDLNGDYVSIDNLELTDYTDKAINIRYIFKRKGRFFTRRRWTPISLIGFTYHVHQSIPKNWRTQSLRPYPFIPLWLAESITKEFKGTLKHLCHGDDPDENNDFGCNPGSRRCREIDVLCHTILSGSFWKSLC